MIDKFFLVLLLATFLSACGTATSLAPSPTSPTSLAPTVIQNPTPQIQSPKPLSTPEMAAPGQQQEDAMFRIYGQNAEGQPAPQAPRSGEQYTRDAANAVARDLAQRQGIPSENIAVVSVNNADIANAAPCAPPAAIDKTQSGIEIVAEADGVRYRYVAAGALAYFCGPTS